MTDIIKEGLTRITINLTPNAKAAVDAAMQMTGDNMTDVVNRAVQLYKYIVDSTENISLYARENDGTYQRIIIL